MKIVKVKSIILPIFYVSSLCFSLLFFTCYNVFAQNDEPEYSYNEFYENLAHYGQWIEDANYGYVWSPNVTGNFRPYFTNGHWAMTQFGNTWVSDYKWGWACFHYGRWIFDSYYGWLWLPGTTWGPAWVMWRVGSGYYGWAPLSPDFQFKPGATPEKYTCPKDWWVFLPPQYLYTGNYYSYWSGPTGNSAILKSATQINNYYENSNITFIYGPYTKEVEKVAKKPIKQFHLGSSANVLTKVHHEEIKMFRPLEIKSLSVFGNNPVPPGVVNATQPITLKPQLINGQKGTPSPQLKSDLQLKPIEHDAQNVKPFSSQKIAPQPPDPVPYNWKNADHEKQADTIEYKVPAKIHPDNGPSQKSDPLPKPKDPNPKKLPAQPVQKPDPVKPEDQAQRK